MTPAAVARAYRAACLAELDALKPGNVHRHGDGHGMSVADFVRSAELSAPFVADPALEPGERIWRAVAATRAGVGTNTNLGIVLLAVPLAGAALRCPSGTPSRAELRAALAAVLAGLTVADAQRAFDAIALAAPAGLGEAGSHDVRRPAAVGLVAAMAEAGGRDSVARQYAANYADVFATGLAAYDRARARWGDPAWAAAAVHLAFLAGWPDSHIARKHGAAVAGAVTAEAVPYRDALDRQDDPAAVAADLARFDASLKARGLNPGTSADLTVATLFAAGLCGP